MPSTLVFSEMSSVLEAVAEPSIGFGERFEAAPQTLLRSALLGPMDPLVPHTPNVLEVTQILGALYCWRSTLNGAVALFVAKSQLPDVFWLTVFCPVVEL